MSQQSRVATIEGIKTNALNTNIQPLGYMINFGAPITCPGKTALHQTNQLFSTIQFSLREVFHVKSKEHSATSNNNNLPVA